MLPQLPSDVRDHFQYIGLTLSSPIHLKRASLELVFDVMHVLLAPLNFLVRGLLHIIIDLDQRLSVVHSEGVHDACSIPHHQTERCLYKADAFLKALVADLLCHLKAKAHLNLNNFIHFWR